MSMFKIWDRESTLYPPAGGQVFTPEVMEEQYPWIRNPQSVVVISEVGGVLQSVDNLEILKANYGVTNADPEEALAEIEAKLEEQRQAQQSYVDPNESILANLQYIGMMLTPVEEV